MTPLKKYMLVSVLAMAGAGLSVRLSAQCNAAFSGQTFGNDYTIQFKNNSTGYQTGTRFYWNFNDGNYSNRTAPVHAFTQAGSYFVCLYLKDSAGQCDHLFCDSVKISASSPGCQANCHWEISGDSVAFYPLCTGTDSSATYTWDFGDGSTSNSETPVHVYAKPGNKTVCIAVNSSICQDTVCRQFYLKPQYTCNAQFTKAVKTDSVSFYHTGHNPKAHYFWTFGDNGTSADEHPVHIYKKNGQYSVCLQVTDTVSNCTDTYCDWVTVKGLPCVRANFVYKVCDLQVDFTSLADSTVDLYWWDFGDKGYASTRDAKHTYPAYGSYDGYYYVEDTSLSSCSERRDFKIVLEQPREFFDLAGTIQASSSVVDFATVYLARLDKVASTLDLVDTAFIQPSDSGKYRFSQLAKGLYVLKAIPDAGSSFAANHAPAYFGGLAWWDWDSATLLRHDVDFDEANISLIATAPTTGTDSLHGFITFDKSMNAQAGQPVANLPVLLLDMNSKVVACSYSNASGHYRFAHLADGLYYLRPDWPGKTSYLVQPPALSATAPAYQVNFSVSVIEIYPEKIIAPVSQPAGLQQWWCYPNPATEQLTIQLPAYSNQVRLYDMTGRQMQVPYIASGSQVTLMLSTVQAGYYIVQIPGLQGAVRLWVQR